VSKETIRAFLEQMKARHGEQIDAIELPEGTRAYLAERAAEEDVETLTFMLKLGYLMGLQTGYAAGAAGEGAPDASGPIGPLQA
jgi:hypothetical protein